MERARPSSPVGPRTEGLLAGPSVSPTQGATRSARAKMVAVEVLRRLLLSGRGTAGSGVW